MSQESTIWHYNDNDFELDIYDEVDAAKYKSAMEKLSEDEKNVKKTGEHLEVIRSYTQIFYNLYDNLFGEGAGIKVLGERRNVRKCNESYDDFLNFVYKQKSDVDCFAESISSKYANRQARRAAKKKVIK